VAHKGGTVGASGEQDWPASIETHSAAALASKPSRRSTRRAVSTAIL